jgi:hypothetical protein
MPAAIGPVAGHRHHPIGDVAQLAQILLGGQHDALPALGIARLIHDQHPLAMRPQIRVHLPLLQPAAVQRVRVPRGVVHKVMQPLPASAGHNGS